MDSLALRVRELRPLLEPDRDQRQEPDGVAKCGWRHRLHDHRSSQPRRHACLIDGNTLPFAPEWIFSGVLNFQSDPFNRGFFGSLDWAYSSDKHFLLYESEEFHSDSLEFGLRLGYGWNGGKYEVALFGRNILDAEIVQGGIDFDNLTGMTNEPRIIGVEFNAKF